VRCVPKAGIFGTVRPSVSGFRASEATGVGLVRREGLGIEGACGCRECKGDTPADERNRTSHYQPAAPWAS
jgi:hypothetical protein